MICHVYCKLSAHPTQKASLGKAWYGMSRCVWLSLATVGKCSKTFVFAFARSLACEKIQLTACIICPLTVNSMQLWRSSQKGLLSQTQSKNIYIKLTWLKKRSLGTAFRDRQDSNKYPLDKLLSPCFKKGGNITAKPQAFTEVISFCMHNLRCYYRNCTQNKPSLLMLYFHAYLGNVAHVAHQRLVG